MTVCRISGKTTFFQTSGTFLQPVDGNEQDGEGGEEDAGGLGGSDQLTQDLLNKEG